MDKKEALKIVQEDGYELGDLSDNFKKDKERCKTYIPDNILLHLLYVKNIYIF